MTLRLPNSLQVSAGNSSDSFIRLYVADSHGRRVNLDTDEEPDLLDNASNRPRLSELLFQESFVKDTFQRWTKEDIKILVDEINILKLTVQDRDLQIRQLTTNNTVSRSLCKGNQHPGSDSPGQTRLLRQLKKEVKHLREISIRHQSVHRLLQQRINSLTQQLDYAGKTIKKLLRFQKKMVQMEELDLHKVDQMKGRFQKQNQSLKQQLVSVSSKCQGYPITDRTNITSESHGKEINSVKREIERMKSDIMRISERTDINNRQPCPRY